MKSLCSAKTFLFNSLLLASILLGNAPTFAQAITENSPLTFGKFIITNNAAIRQIELLSGGGFNADPEYVFFIDPQMGNVTVTGYPPATPLTVTVGVTDLDPMGGGVVNFSTGVTFTNPAAIVTDGAGEVTFDVGATLSSDGSGSTHTDDDYDGIYSIVVAP